jgi:Homeodomain-like domain
VEVGLATVARVRQRFGDEGLEAALAPRPSPRTYARKRDGAGEAHLIACATPPEGRKGWTLRLLADRMVALGRVEELSYETVRRVLKKTSSSLG